VYVLELHADRAARATYTGEGRVHENRRKKMGSTLRRETGLEVCGIHGGPSN
jgi:hypothetical protein